MMVDQQEKDQAEKWFKNLRIKSAKNLKIGNRPLRVSPAMI